MGWRLALGLGLVLASASLAASQAQPSVGIDVRPMGAPLEPALAQKVNVTVRFCYGTVPPTQATTIRVTLNWSAPWLNASLAPQDIAFPAPGGDGIAGNALGGRCEERRSNLTLLAQADAPANASTTLALTAKMVSQDDYSGRATLQVQVSPNGTVAPAAELPADPTSAAPTDPIVTEPATTTQPVSELAGETVRPPPYPAWAPWAAGGGALAGLVVLVVARQRKPAATTERYRLVRELPRGAYGRAFVAQDLVLGRRVVVKEPLSGAIEETLREARLAGQANHPNVVTVHDVDGASSPPRIVMEFVEGGSLADRLARGPIPPREAARIVGDVLAGLGAVHRLGLVHRDVKPSNILLTREGRAKVADFGIARPASVATTPRSAPGTPLYMSPEQARGRADARSDLYAVGLVLHEMLTGSRAWDGHALVLDPRLAGPARAIVERALADDPAARFQSADEMRAELSQLG